MLSARRSTGARAELVSFKNTDGVPLKGLLLKPDNFDPKKKYPMIVYIYEKLTQGLHAFRNPATGYFDQSDLSTSATAI